MRIYTDENGLGINALMGPKQAGHNYVALVGDTTMCVDFQNGTIPDEGLNGLTNEALLHILVHRTKILNDLYPCRENSIAITKMQEAIMWFEERTQDRVNRGVEGSNEL